MAIHSVASADERIDRRADFGVATDYLEPVANLSHLSESDGIFGRHVPATVGNLCFLHVGPNRGTGANKLIERAAKTVFLREKAAIESEDVLRELQRACT